MRKITKLEQFEVQERKLSIVEKYKGNYKRLVEAGCEINIT